MAVLTDALKELATDGELESAIVSCLRLGPFVDFDLQKDNQKY